MVRFIVGCGGGVRPITLRRSLLREREGDLELRELCCILLARKSAATEGVVRPASSLLSLISHVCARAKRRSMSLKRSVGTILVQYRPYRPLASGPTARGVASSGAFPVPGRERNFSKHIIDKMSDMVNSVESTTAPLATADGTVAQPGLMQPDGIADDDSDASSVVPDFLRVARQHLDCEDAISLSDFSLIDGNGRFQGRAVRMLRKEEQALAAQTAAEAAAEARRRWTAALQVQCLWHGHRARSKRRLMALENARDLRAAVALQASVRRTQSRKRYLLRREESTQAAAATRIQGAYRRFATTFVRNPIVTKTRLKAQHLKSKRCTFITNSVDRLASKLLGQPSSRVALFATVIVLALTCTGRIVRDFSLAPAVDPLGCEAQLRLDTLLERLHVLELQEARVLERERRFHSLEQQEAIVLERERRLEALQRELSSQQRQLDIATAKKRERPATHAFPQMSDYFAGYRQHRDYVARRLQQK